MAEARVNDCILYYELQGEGPDLVFIHGEDHGIEQFDDQVARFSRDHRCLRYYRRGHGKSGSPLFGYSVWNQTLDLRGLLDHLSIRKPAIVALGLGNPVAVSFALRYPDRVRALALVSWYELDGYPLMEERRRPVHRMPFSDLHLKMYEVRCTQGRVGLLRFIEQQADVLFPIFPLQPELRSRMARMVASHPPGHYIQAVEHYSSIPNLVPEMARIACPILGICGTADPSPDRPALLERNANFSQVWIEGARRFSQMERPDEFNRVLAAFLDALPTGISDRAT